MLALPILFISSANAQLEANVDRDTIHLGETFTLTISSASDETNQPDFNSLSNDFDVLSTSGNTSISVINGKTDRKIVWEATLRPKTAGKITISPIKVGSQQTEPITVTIEKPVPADPNVVANSNVIIEMETSTASPFVQQNFYITVRLLFAVNLYSGDLTQPKANNLVVKDLAKEKQYRTTRNQKTYQVIERKYVVYAEKSGQINVGPVVFSGKSVPTARNPSGNEEYQTSPALLLDIKPIPTDFANVTWLVSSDLQLKENWSKKPYKVGEAITRTIEITATDLNETQLPEIQMPIIKKVKQYNDATQSETKLVNSKMVSTKTFKVVMIPEQAGEINIPQYNLVWFDTKDKTKHTATLSATTLKIEDNPNQVSLNNNQNNQNNINNQLNKTDKGNGLDSSVNEKSINKEQLLDKNKDSDKWRNFVWILSIILIMVLIAVGYLLLKIKQLQMKLLQKSNSNENSLTNQHKEKVYKNIDFLPKDNTPSAIQSALIVWWNAKYQQQTSHLGQIISQLDDSKLIDDLNELQQSIYNNKKLSANKSIEYWQQFIKNKSLLPNISTDKLNKGKDKNSLPELYH